jgi:hypothetical protein
VVNARKVFATLAVFAAMLVGALVGPSPAQAVGSCSNNWICFWNTSSSTGAILKMDNADTSSGECHTLPSAATSYITNRGGYQWRLYTNSLCTSWPAGTLYAETDGGIGSPWNNNSRSFKRA